MADMSVEIKRKKLLKDLSKNGGTQLIVDLKPRGADYFHVVTDSHRCKARDGRFPPSHLPFRRPNTALVSYQGSRIIGHIYGLNTHMEILINRKQHLKTEAVKVDQKKRVQTKYLAPIKDSNPSTAKNFVNASDLYTEGDHSRHTSSSSSTSVALEKKHIKSPHISHRQRNIKNGGTKLHERFTESDSLPVVCTDENISANVHMLPINVRQNRSHQQIMQQTSNVSSMYPGNHRNGSSNSPKTQHINSLSISGIKQDGAISSGSKNEGAQPDENEGEPLNERLNKVNNDETSNKTGKLSRADQTDKLDKIDKPYFKSASPHSLSIDLTAVSQSHQLQPGASNNGIPQYIQPFKRRQIKTHTTSAAGRSANKPRLEQEPKYSDPVVGSSMSFQSRLAELASLEAETVRWERLRKLKKKAKDD